jgi:hypothetical protein
VLSAGSADDESVVSRAIDLALALARDQGRLRAMAGAGRQFIDGQGARRAASAILQHAGHRANQPGLAG